MVQTRYITSTVLGTKEAAARLTALEPSLFKEYVAALREEAISLRSAIRYVISVRMRRTRKLLRSVKSRVMVRAKLGLAGADVYSGYFKLRLWDQGFAASSVTVKPHVRRVKSGNVRGAIGARRGKIAYGIAFVREYVRHTPTEKTHGRLFFESVFKARRDRIESRLRSIADGVSEVV
jgi:hypothetical protein